MYYDFAITVPGGLLAGTIVDETLKLTKGVIHRVEVQFPAGCAGLVHCKIYHEGHQLYPTDPDGNLASDDYTIPIDDYFELKTAPYSLKARCWNDDDTYDHTITIRVGVLPQEVISPFSGIGGMLRKFLKLVGLGG